MIEKQPPLESSEETPMCHEDMVDYVAEAAQDAGIDADLLPKPKTEAHMRLCKLAKDYSKEVHLQMVGRSHDDSHSVRRALHSDLCVMIYGRPHNELSPEKIKQVRNFAHLLAGRDQYVD